MTDKTALRALIEAVEAGTLTWDDVLDFGCQCDAVWPVGYYPICHAYQGSLDAAKRLHDALVPDWNVDDMGENGRVANAPWGVRLAKWDARNPSKNKWVSAGYGADSIPDKNPARAWLLAILKAKESET